MISTNTEPKTFLNNTSLTLNKDEGRDSLPLSIINSMKKRGLNIQVGNAKTSDFKEISDEDLEENPVKNLHNKLANDPIIPFSFLMNRNKMKNFNSSNCVPDVMKNQSIFEKLAKRPPMNSWPLIFHSRQFFDVANVLFERKNGTIFSDT